MGRHDSQQVEVGRAQGASEMFIKDTGFFDLGDGASSNGSQFTGRQLQLDLLSRMTQTFLTLSTNSVLAVSVLAPAYGYINISMPLSAASCVLPQASKGARLILDLAGVESALQIKAAAGASLINWRGSQISRLSITTNGSAVSTIIGLACVTDGTWSVISYRDGSSAVLEVAGS